MSSELEGTPELEAAPVAVTPTPEPETTTPAAEVNPEWQPEGTTEESDTEEQPELSTVLLEDGTEEKVTAEEQRRGYLREQDYTQKTMALAEQRREVEAKAQKLTTIVEQGEALVTGLAQEFEAEFANVDWDKLAAEDPAEYIRLTHKRASAAQKVQAKLYQLNQAKEAQQAHVAESIRAQVAEEGNRLLTMIPEWKDAAKREAGSAEVRNYLTSAGYAPEEVAGVTDHRAVVLARKAMLYDRAMSRLPAAKPVTAAPPPPTPVTTKSKAAPVNEAKMTDEQWYRREQQKRNLKQFKR